MKGLIVTKPGAPYELVSDIPKPTPGLKQVLVKSLYTGINPVYSLPSPMAPTRTRTLLTLKPERHSCR